MQEWFLVQKDKFYLNFIKDDRWRYLWDGLGATLQITFFAVLLGIVIGMIVASIKSTHDKTIDSVRIGIVRFFLKLLNFICNLFLTIIRGTPVVVQLLIAYYIVFQS